MKLRWMLSIVQEAFNFKQVLEVDPILFKDIPTDLIDFCNGKISDIGANMLDNLSQIKEENCDVMALFESQFNQSFY